MAHLLAQPYFSLLLAVILSASIVLLARWLWRKKITATKRQAVYPQFGALKLRSVKPLPLLEAAVPPLDFAVNPELSSERTNECKAAQKSMSGLLALSAERASTSAPCEASAERVSGDALSVANDILLPNMDGIAGDDKVDTQFDLVRAYIESQQWALAAALLQKIIREGTKDLSSQALAQHLLESLRCASPSA